MSGGARADGQMVFGGTASVEIAVAEAWVAGSMEKRSDLGTAPIDAMFELLSELADCVECRLSRGPRAEFLHFSSVQRVRTTPITPPSATIGAAAG
jgi:hypothetical protein